ncbi:hypothetical protein OCT63_19475 [Vibrio sp. RW]|uniref:hypothetical protein n=1 Tax=Vibrio sp. RW TaxID=2998833 RepID=UPI0022CD35A2|nr:hypothetical protein [Vibrio sp. RW]MDA0146410.1 hypothetical protein [Vibrio sp. RW]
MKSNNAWVAAVSGRPDIHFFSMFSLDFLSADERQAQLSRTLSTIFGFGVNEDGDCVIGVPDGEIWDSILKIHMDKYEVVETPTSLCSAFQLTFHYTTVSSHIIKKRTRLGTTNDTEKLVLECSMSFPINDETARLISDKDTLYLTAYGHDYKSIDKKRLKVKKLIHS